MQNNSTRPAPGIQPYLLTAEVATILAVSPKTVSRWAKDGKLAFQRTLGHRRYPAATIQELAATLGVDVEVRA